MPIQRRLPKRGFTNIFKKKISVVNLRDLVIFQEGDVVDEVALRQAGLVKGQVDGVKLLAEGDITSPLTIRLSGVSAGARVKIEAVGGKIE
jgi:large subunit ribosomal protein L15